MEVTYMPIPLNQIKIVTSPGQNNLSSPISNKTEKTSSPRPVGM